MSNNQKLHIVTGNKDKFLQAKAAFSGFKFDLVQTDIDVPEIQSNSIQDIAGFSAEWVSNKLQAPVAITDVAYEISVLKGFPGPFIKYINTWLTEEDILRLLSGLDNREVVVKECLAYSDPGHPPKYIVGEAHGTIAKSYSRKGSTPINSLFIPQGYNKTIPFIQPEEMTDFWNNQFNNWPRLAKILQKTR